LPTRRSELPNDLAAVQMFVDDSVFRNRRYDWMKLTKNLVVLAGVVGLASIVAQVLMRRK
jgi:hypothetical protein